MLLKQQWQLIQSGVISEAQIAEAELIDKSKKQGLLMALLENDGVDDDALLSALATIYKTSYIDISHLTVNQSLLQICPEKLCMDNECVPVRQNETDIVIAVGDPLDAGKLDVLAFKLGKRITPLFARPDFIQHKIAELYQGGDATFDAKMADLDDGQVFARKITDPAEIADPDELKRGAEESPIIKLVNSMIMQALKIGASDIHIEAAERQSVVRMRVDGRLRPMLHFPARTHPLVVSRIKIMSKMDIANSRTPQDGRARFELRGKPYDMRISTLPSMHGEKVVMRILDKGGLALSLDVLCFEEAAYKRIRECIALPTGAILVTGPTGSGKTTTLYSFLHHIRDEEMNMITVEDPVEYQIEGINQVQVNTRAGMTFANVLRSILRQDPDVVMVGEIRDGETAEIAMHAAQTGHLVLSTLHTNDAPSTITRLLDMGIEASMLASSLNLIVAQRLARRLCTHCRREAHPNAELIERLDIPDGITFYEKQGCRECMNIGYKGRLSIHEVLYVNDHMRRLIVHGAADHELMQAARQQGMFTLFEDGFSKVLSGQTSIQELIRVCSLPEEFSLREHLDENQQLTPLGVV